MFAGFEPPGNPPTYNIPTLEETRYISGRGLMYVPFKADTRRIYLRCFVARDPQPNYLNYKYNDPKGNYATILWYKGGCVVREDIMEWEAQRFEWNADISGQAIYAQNCGFYGVQRTLVLLGEGLNVTLAGVLGRAFYPLNDYPEEIRIVCRDNCAVRVELWRHLLDRCSIQAPDEREPEIPPPPPPKVPPGTPLDGEDDRPTISPPYDGEDDLGDTVPADIDKPGTPPEPPPISNGDSLVWNFSTNLNPRSTRATAAFVATAPVTNYRVTRLINVDEGQNAANWEAKFVDGNGVERTGSAVGSLNPEDKPRMHIWLASDPPESLPRQVLG